MNLKGSVSKIIETTLSSEKAVKTASQLDTSSQAIYMFNETGNLTEELWWFITTNDSVKTTYIFDSIGTKIGNTYISYSPHFINENKYILDSVGRVIESISFTINGDSISRETYTYNEYGFQTSRKTYAAFAIGGGLLYTHQSVYDSNNIKMHLFFFTKDSSVFRNTAYFGDSNLPDKSIYIPKKGRQKTSTYHYTFDEMGNWTKKTTLLGKKVQFIEIREITYN
jgi:hypothetical protein